MMKIHFCCLSVCLSNHSFKNFFFVFFCFFVRICDKHNHKIIQIKKLFPFFFSILVITNY